MLFSLICLLVHSGCSFFRTDSSKNENDAVERVISKASQPAKDTPKQEQEVRFDGGLLLGNADDVAFHPTQLSKLISELLDAGKKQSVRNIVTTYPDVVSKVLLREGPPLSHRQMTQLAQLFDQHWGVAQSSSWVQFVSQTSRNATADRFFQERSEFLTMVGNNQPEQALQSGLMRDRQGDVMEAEVNRLEGIAHLMLEQYSQSIEKLNRSVELLENEHPYLASKNLLLLGEAQRHAKLLADWKSTWNQAVELQSRLIEQKDLKDPAFWTKAAFLRPVSTVWSPVGVDRLQRALKKNNLDFGADQALDAEAIVWATIGIQSLQRHESQNAILALKKSEALVVGNQLKTELQLQQAIAMIDGGQPGPASAILLRISSTPSINGDRAKAILATLKLQQGSLAQGMNLLQSAIQSSQQWPKIERLRAHADYALSFLMRGREKQGVALLEDVLIEFQNMNETQQAIQCLTNLATYYEKTEQTAAYRSTIARLNHLETL